MPNLSPTRNYGWGAAFWLSRNPASESALGQAAEPTKATLSSPLEADPDSLAATPPTTSPDPAPLDTPAISPLGNFGAPSDLRLPWRTLSGHGSQRGSRRCRGASLGSVPCFAARISPFADSRDAWRHLPVAFLGRRSPTAAPATSPAAWNYARSSTRSGSGQTFDIRRHSGDGAIPPDRGPPSGIGLHAAPSTPPVGHARVNNSGRTHRHSETSRRTRRGNIPHHRILLTFDGDSRHDARPGTRPVQLHRPIGYTPGGRAIRSGHTSGACRQTGDSAITAPTAYPQVKSSAGVRRCVARPCASVPANGNACCDSNTSYSPAPTPAAEAADVSPVVEQSSPASPLPSADKPVRVPFQAAWTSVPVLPPLPSLSPRSAAVPESAPSAVDGRRPGGGNSHHSAFSGSGMPLPRRRPHR